VPARHDLATDPQVLQDLATVRLGTSFFRRALDQVSDDDLDGPSLLPSWDRRHLVAHVGYNARAVARLVDWAATGVETPMYSSTRARSEEIELGATLNPEALRNLCEHAAVDLDVRWRDLPADRWQARVVTAQGRDVPAAETVWMRTREVWLHAVDLASGERIDEVPRLVLLRLLGDILKAWGSREESPVRLVTTDALPDEPGSLGASDDTPGVVTVAGCLPALAAWGTGRLGADQRAAVLSFVGSDPVPAPRWI
jgi:maleylpyruvate isomerase